jgi:hypothetical protein
VITKLLEYFKNGVSVIAVGGWFLNDVLFNGGYFVVQWYLVMC